MKKQINHIQLRAARHALNMGTRDMGKLLGVGATTLASHERLTFGVKGFDKFITKFSQQLIEFFAENNIIFPDSYSIELKIGNDILNAMSKAGGQMTRFQLRVARYVLNISQVELSKLSGISEYAINTHESKKNSELLYTHKKEEPIELKYKKWFLSHGIEFIGNFKVSFQNFSSTFNG